MRMWAVLLSFLLLLFPAPDIGAKTSLEQIQVALILDLRRYIQWPDQTKMSSINAAVIGLDYKL